MTSTSLFASAVWISALTIQIQNDTESLSSEADDGRVRVVMSVKRATVPPGEVQEIEARCEVLTDKPLRFPSAYSPLSYVFLRTPTGSVYVYPQSGVSPVRRPPPGDRNYADDRHTLFEKGRGVELGFYHFPMINPSTSWLWQFNQPGPWMAPGTFERQSINLSIAGQYEVWLKLEIPKSPGQPADAWHGAIETKPVRFRVREIPVAERRSKPTAEQLAHLDAFMNYREALAVDPNAKPQLPEAVEMPGPAGIERRLEWALLRTENEGFARHVVALLRKEQAQEGDQPYPPWWSSLEFFIQRRLAVEGPYWDDFAEVAMREAELQLAGRNRSSASDGGAGKYLEILLTYFKKRPDSTLKARLEKLAREHAQVPEGAKEGRREVLAKLSFSWRALYALGVLRDGMPWKEAQGILGAPHSRKENDVTWDYETGSRIRGPGVQGRIVATGFGETIVFTNRAAWRR